MAVVLKIKLRMGSVFTSQLEILAATWLLGLGPAELLYEYCATSSFALANMPFLRCGEELLYLRGLFVVMRSAVKERCFVSASVP